MKNQKLSRDELVNIVTDSIIAEEAECPDDVKFYGLVIGYGESLEISVNDHTVSDLVDLSDALNEASRYILSVAHGQIDDTLLNKKVDRRKGGVVIYEQSR